MVPPDSRRDQIYRDLTPCTPRNESALRYQVPLSLLEGGIQISTRVKRISGTPAKDANE